MSSSRKHHWGPKHCGHMVCPNSAGIKVSTALSMPLQSDIVHDGPQDESRVGTTGGKYCTLQVAAVWTWRLTPAAGCIAPPQETRRLQVPVILQHACVHHGCQRDLGISGCICSVVRAGEVSSAGAESAAVSSDPQGPAPDRGLIYPSQIVLGWSGRHEDHQHR